MHRPARKSIFDRVLIALAALVAAVVLAATAAPASAAIDVRHTYAGPIETGSPCTAEPRAPIYFNTAFNPATAVSGANAPGVEDVRPRHEAGARADYCVAYSLTPNLSIPARAALTTEAPDPAADPTTGDDHRDIVLDTPEGFAGAAGSAEVCDDADFGIGSIAEPHCAIESQVGDGLIRAHVGPIPFPQGIVIGDGGVAIFNLPTTANEAARLGIVASSGLLAPAKFIVRIVFTGGERNRLRSIVEDAPRTVFTADGSLEVPIYVESVGLRFWGEGGLTRQGFNPSVPTMITTAHPFAEVGTQCGVDLSADVSITTYTEHQSSATTEPHQLSGCEALSFGPHVSVDTQEKAPGVPTGATVRLALDQSAGNDPGTALLREARVRLPDGLEIGAQIGSRPGSMVLCSAAAFGELEQRAPDCPPESRVGSVRIVSPLLQKPLVGDVFLGPQSAVGKLPDLFLSTAFEGATAADAPRIKLAGRTEVDAQGRVTSTFPRNPQLRFATLDLQFDGGPNALLTTPRACGATSGAATGVPWSGGAAVDATPSLTIDQDCATPPFQPTVSVAATNPRAGAKAPTHIVVERADRSPWLDRVAVSLPPGLLADLNGVPECSAAAAQAAACPADTRIAAVTVIAGAGSQPYTQTGAMYLTARPPGAVAGATIITHAKIGDVDLGQVVVPGRINLRPTDAGLDYISDVPMRVHGVALSIRAIGVALDRPGFALNPSSCGPLGYTGSFVGEGGVQASNTGTIAYSGCAELPFKPDVETELSGRGVRAGGHPNVHFTINTRPGDSNLRATRLTLPSGMSTDLKNLQVTCTMEQFHANACPAATDVGWVNADVRIAPERIRGQVYLVRVPGETLPGLGLSFTGRFAQRVVSRVQITKSGRIMTDFSSIPDLPLKRLEVRIFGGDKGPIQLGRTWCNPRTQWSTLVVAQGRQEQRVRSRLRCAHDARVRFGDGRGLSVRQFGLQGRKLQSIKVTLPKGYSFDKSRARSSRYGWVRTKGESRRPRIKVTKRTFRAAPRGRRASNVRINLDGAAIRASARARSRSERVTLKVRLSFTNGGVETQRIRVRPR